MKQTLIDQIEQQSEIIKNAQNAKKDLENQLKDLLIKESGLKTKCQYVDKRNVKIWIDRFDLQKWSNRYLIKAITYKVKKDGTNGMQSHSSWGYDVEDIKIIEGN